MGWYIGEEKFDFSKQITENIILKAKWEKGEAVATIYTITLDIDGKKSTLKTDESGMLAEPEKPTKEGYTFLGWYIGDEKVDFSKPFTSNSDVVAKWEKEEEKKEENTTNKSENNTSTTPSKPTTPTTPSKPTEPTTPTTPTEPEKPIEPEKPSEPETPTTPTEPSEPETPVVTKYTVTVKVDGRVVSTQEVEKGKKLSSLPANPTKAGYTFKGWYSNGSKVTTDTVVSANMTITGEWDTYTFSVSLINNDQYSPNRLITAYKNGAQVGITAIYGNYNGNSEYTLGKWNSSLGAVKITSYQQFSSASNYKIQLNDGTKVFANGN